MKFKELVPIQPIIVGGRSSTPVLEMPNITKENTLMVTVSFQAQTEGTEATNGFTFTIKPTNLEDARPISGASGQVQAAGGWTTYSRTAFFEAEISSPTGVEDVDFEVIFEKGDMDGKGSIINFMITGSVVSLVNP